MYHHSNLVFKRGDSLPQPKDYSKKNIYIKAAFYVYVYIQHKSYRKHHPKKLYNPKITLNVNPFPTHLRFGYSITILVYSTHIFCYLKLFFSNVSNIIILAPAPNSIRWSCFRFIQKFRKINKIVETITTYFLGIGA